MKSVSIPLAKITRPGIKRCYPRQRLFKLLDTFDAVPCSWIAGPAGSGKTTLVSSYVEQRGFQCLWYRVDNIDQDISSFFYYIGLAAMKAAPRRRKSLPLLTPEYLTGLKVFARNFCEMLYSYLTPPAVVVLDDYHMMTGNEPFHDVIQLFLENIPEGLRVIIMSRMEPVPQFARLHGNQKMKIINWNEMKLTHDETRNIVRAFKTVNLDKDRVKRLHEYVDGWAAGLILLLESTKTVGIDITTRGDLDSSVIFDYFATEIFNALDNDVQQFLKKTALIPFMDIKLAENITGNQHAGSILENLHKKNYFTERRASTPVLYQYHPLFMWFLKRKALKDLSSSVLRDIRAKAVTHLLESGHYEDAAGLLIDSQDWNGLTRLVFSYAKLLIQQGRNNLLEGWLKKIPHEEFSSDPWLNYWMGVCRFPFNVIESLELYKNAFNIFQDLKSPEGMYLSWSGIVNAIAIRFEGYEELDKWIKKLEELRKAGYETKDDYIEAHVAASMYIALLQRRYDHPSLDMWMERAFDLTQRTGNINLEINVRSFFAIYLQHKGELQRAMIETERLRRMAQMKGTTVYSHLKVELIESMIYNLLGDFSKCASIVTKGLELAQKTGVHVYDYLMMGQLVRVSIKNHKFDVAEEYLERMKSRLEAVRPLEKYYFYFLAALLSLESGDTRFAVEYAETARTLALSVNYMAINNVVYLLVAQLKLELGKEDEALHCVSLARKHNDRMKSDLYEYMNLLTEAQIYFWMRDEKEAVLCLRGAMMIGTEKGYYSHYMWRSSVMTDLCTKALENNVEIYYVKELIRRNTLLPVREGLNLEQWPWPVRIYALGRFSILRDDEPVKTEGRAQKKPMEMLKVIVAFGGRQISEESISDILWPEAAGDAAHNAFTTTMSRLRKILGIDGAIEVREGRVTLKQNVCWVDIWTFERLIGEADGAWRHGDSDRARMLADRAFAIYSGAFLLGEDDHWNISTREKLKSKFLRNVINLGRYLEESNMWNEALEHYRRGLEVDELMEEFYKRAMVCCIKLDRKAEAAAIYERCAETLEKILGIQPSRETKELLLRIQR